MRIPQRGFQHIHYSLARDRVVSIAPAQSHLDSIAGVGLGLALFALLNAMYTCMIPVTEEIIPKNKVRKNTMTAIQKAAQASLFLLSKYHCFIRFGVASS